MRTTVEITDEQRAQLMKLAAERHEKGFSSLVREAIELYLKQGAGRRGLIGAALAVRGSLAEEDVDEIKACVARLRKRWR